MFGQMGLGRLGLAGGGGRAEDSAPALENEDAGFSANFLAPADKATFLKGHTSGNGYATEASFFTGSRAAGYSFPLSAIPTLGSEYSFYFDFILDDVTTFNQYIFGLGDGTFNEYVALRAGSGFLNLLVNDGGVSQVNFALGAIVAGQRHRVTVRIKANAVVASFDGKPPGLGNQDITVTLPTVTTCYVWGFNGSGSLKPQGAFGVKNFVIVPRDITARHMVAWQYPLVTDPTPYDVFLLVGQSNHKQGQAFNAGIDVAHVSIDMVNQAGVVSQALEPLPHVTTTAARIGFAHTFARDYYLPNALAVGRKVLLVPAALDATGFTDGRWNIDNDLYTNALALLGFALAKYPNAVLKGILWMQGEQDAVVPMTEVNYAAALDAMVAGMRAQFGVVPFIVGGMVPEWVAADAGRQPVQDALEDTPNRLASSAYADPLLPSQLPGASGEIIHYSAASQRLFAARWWTAYASIA